MQQTAGPSILMRLAALVVLVIAGWVVLHLIVGVVTWLATMVVVIVAVVAVVWALRVLL
jgi:hypothetical protein